MEDFFKKIKGNPVSNVESDTNQDETVIENKSKSDSIKSLIESLTTPAPAAELANLQKMNEKLIEITERSQAALEDLKSQSAQIIETTRNETNKVLESAKYNLSVFTKEASLDEELESKSESKLAPVGTSEMMNLFN